ncbi:MAG: 1-deoxy-D-xylulose-5-phosphate reductoisomerase [Deltaproteobacteria bacterium]|nr:1-deoxy-D-xylulose-5-phosphate reductoisomerase [Deltaproteobacteria bacterium]
MRVISILGSTGSIGTSTLDVVRNNPEKFKVAGLACGSNLDLLVQQIQEFKPQYVSVGKAEDVAKLQAQLGNGFSEIGCGMQGNITVATLPETDMVISAIVGAAGLEPTLSALKAKKAVGLANKETLVVAGSLMTQVAKKQQVTLLPIDSEHSAIFQCLVGQNRDELRKIIITASGGPFLHKPRDEFSSITVEQALKHPNWSMGAKITIDSATLMNKGLEVIEAKWLFDLEPEEIEVVIHPQSIIHSMIEFHDGSILAQLGIPDMRVPIAYALSFPERLPNSLPSLSLTEIGSLTFFPPDYEKFNCLKLARQSLSKGGSYTAVLNAANEVAVKRFLEKKIGFSAIPYVVEATLEKHQSCEPASVDEILAIDKWARFEAERVTRNYVLN